MCGTRLSNPWLIPAACCCSRSPRNLRESCDRRLRGLRPSQFSELFIGGAAVWKFKQAEPPQVMRFDYELPEGQEFSEINYLNLAVSPDGKQFVYSTPKGLYLRSMDDLTAKLISGTEGNTSQPFFSPDGKWIGYVSNNKLKKIAVNGGAPWDLYTYFNVARGAWWDEHNIITYSQYTQDIMQISSDGGTPRSVVKLKSGALYYPQILPDGKSVLYTSIPASSPPKIMVQSLETGEAKELFPGFNARYVPSGHILYMLPNNKNLFAVQFDAARLHIKGEPVPVLEPVRQYAISASGTLVYMPGTSSSAAAKRTLVWVNREGKEEPLSVPPNEYYDLRISPDGKRVALQVRTSKNNIWIWDLARKTMMPLTFDEGAGSASPLWTPDGKRILYSWDRENGLLGGVYWKASDGSGEAEKLASSPGRGLTPWSFSKDGKSVALWEVTPSPLHWDIGLLSMEGDHARQKLIQEKYFAKDPRISPNGRWMAYASNESGKYEVYVCPFPDVKKGKWKVSASGGNHPLWSPDGRELFYSSSDATMAVPVETDPQFKLNGTPSVLFPGKLGKIIGANRLAMADHTYWDISPDGKRFLMLKDSPDEAPRKINIVLNWLEELKQRVPGSKN